MFAVSVVQLSVSDDDFPNIQTLLIMCTYLILSQVLVRSCSSTTF